MHLIFIKIHKCYLKCITEGFDNKSRATAESNYPLKKQKRVNASGTESRVPGVDAETEIYLDCEETVILTDKQNLVTKDGNRQSSSEYKYVMPITVAIVNLSTVAFTPAHLFSKLLGDFLERFVIISLTYSVAKTFERMFEYFDRGEHAALYCLVYLITYNSLVFYVYSEPVFIAIVVFSTIVLIYDTMKQFLLRG